MVRGARWTRDLGRKKPEALSSLGGGGSGRKEGPRPVEKPEREVEEILFLEREDYKNTGQKGELGIRKDFLTVKGVDQ